MRRRWLHIERKVEKRGVLGKKEDELKGEEKRDK